MSWREAVRAVESVVPPDAKGALDEYDYDNGYEREGAYRLIVAWAAHVDRIRDEAHKSEADPTAWTGYDLVAALIIRDKVDSCVARMPSHLRFVAESALHPWDELFRAMTREDGEGLIHAFADDGPPRDSHRWWWHRIPTSGPILQDLES